MKMQNVVKPSKSQQGNYIQPNKQKFNDYRGPKRDSLDQYQAVNPVIRINHSGGASLLFFWRFKMKPSSGTKPTKTQQGSHAGKVIYSAGKGTQPAVKKIPYKNRKVPPLQ